MGFTPWSGPGFMEGGYIRCTQAKGLRYPSDGDKEAPQKAASLEVALFGDWKASWFGSIPGVFWLIPKLSNRRIGKILALCLAY
jgi:hypothetical protein